MFLFILSRGKSKLDKSNVCARKKCPELFFKISVLKIRAETAQMTFAPAVAPPITRTKPAYVVLNLSTAEQEGVARTNLSTARSKTYQNFGQTFSSLGSSEIVARCDLPEKACRFTLPAL
jgi:hypothetical protein